MQSTEASEEPRVGTLPLKYIVLVLLVLQNSLTAILARASRIPSTSGTQLYLGSVAVFVAEVIKLPVCVGLIARDAGGVRPMIVEIWQQVFVKWRDTLRMGVPALCYCLQNALFFVALSRLSATSYQLWSQSKTLFTALFFVVYLGQVCCTRAPIFWFTASELAPLPDAGASQAAMGRSCAAHSRCRPRAVS